MKSTFPFLLLCLIVTASVTAQDSPSINSQTKQEVNTNSTNQSEGSETPENEANDNKFFDDIFAVLKEMGLDQQETITKAQFGAAFKKIMTKGDSSTEDNTEQTSTDENEFFDNVINRMMEDVPDTVEVKNMSTYFDPMKIAAIFQELLGDVDWMSMMEDNTNNSTRKAEAAEGSEIKNGKINEGDTDL